MPLRSIASGIVLALLIAAVGVTSATAAPAVTGEFSVPGLADANDKIVEGPDGNMWVTVAAGGKDVARITPTGEVKEFEVAGITAPSGIAKGPEGKLWVTFEGGVASFSPSSPETAAETAIAAVKGGSSIVAGPDGNMWVASPVLGNGEVIRFSPATPALATPVPVSPKLVPKDIDAVGSLIAIASAGENPRIVTLTTAGVEKDYPIAGGSQGVAGNNVSGLIAYSQQEHQPEQVGLIAPPNLLPPVDLPGGLGDPFGVAFGSDEAFWAVLFAKDGVERLTAGGQISFLGGLKTGSMPRQIAAGPGNTLWVTETKNEDEAVARISGLEPPVKPPPSGEEPQTKLKGSKGTVKTKGRVAKVKFRFSSSSPGASFECRLNRRGAKKRKKATASKVVPFKTCSSPKKYSLKPGRYRFEVRAVLAGVADKSPASSSFKVVHVTPKHHR